MDTALGWIGAVVEWLGRFIPRREILDSTQAAIKFVRGKPVYCPPEDVYWYWPWTTIWNDYPIANQVDRLETQVIESKDHVTFGASGTLRYEVIDLMALVPRTENPMSAIAEIASTALMDVLCDRTWEELLDMNRRGTLKTQLKNAAQRELSDLGVKVVRFKLNSLAKTRVFKISQSTASEEN